MSRWPFLAEQRNDPPAGCVARRNVVIAAAMWPALALVGAVFTQSKKPPVVIGWLSAGHRPEAGRRDLAEFKKELATLGWQEGVNYVLEERYAAGQLNRLPALAAELAAKEPALIVVTPAVATIAAAKAAPRVPIVQASGNSPTSTGLPRALRGLAGW